MAGVPPLYGKADPLCGGGGDDESAGLCPARRRQAREGEALPGLSELRVLSQGRRAVSGGRCRSVGCRAGGDGGGPGAPGREAPAFGGCGGLREAVVPGHSQGGESRGHRDAGPSRANVLQRLWNQPQRTEGKSLGALLSNFWSRF